MKKLVDNVKILMYNKQCVSDKNAFKLHKRLWIRSLEKYSRGRRGAPAKGIGRVTGARVQIPPSPFFETEKSFKKIKKMLTIGKNCDNLNKLSERRKVEYHKELHKEL